MQTASLATRIIVAAGAWMVLLAVLLCTAALMAPALTLAAGIGALVAVVYVLLAALCWLIRSVDWSYYAERLHIRTRRAWRRRRPPQVIG